MKSPLLFINLFVSLFFISCNSSFYQILEVVPINSSNEEKSIVFQNEHCKIQYNLWDEGGDIGFVITNNSDQNLYLNLEESFYILNGLANNYYKSRTYSNSKVVGNSYTRLYSSGNRTNDDISQGKTTSYKEEKIVIIPPHTSKLVYEYKILNYLYRDCDLSKYPVNKKDVYSKKFTEYNSPIVFSNLLSYTLGKSEKEHIIKNEFYVSEVSNHKAKDIIELKYQEHCGKKTTNEIKVNKQKAVNRFYFQYKKGVDRMPN